MRMTPMTPNSHPSWFPIWSAHKNRLPAGWADKNSIVQQPTISFQTGKIKIFAKCVVKLKWPSGSRKKWQNFTEKYEIPWPLTPCTFAIFHDRSKKQFQIPRLFQVYHACRNPGKWWSTIKRLISCLYICYWYVIHKWMQRILRYICFHCCNTLTV